MDLGALEAILGARIFIDMVINHTGWGSDLQERHPDWFRRNPDGSFASPGAWGTTWEDLVELEHGATEVWQALADAFLTWCRRGVDGFRCDAGYKVPLPVWQYITARVRQEYPDTIFLLEGLGGRHKVMQWHAAEVKRPPQQAQVLASSSLTAVCRNVSQFTRRLPR